MTRPPAERGFVSLVGAGPGDPDLLTRKAADRLADADLVLYDALVDPATLALAPSAQRVFVGKRAGRPQVRQEFIHWLMIRAARAGKKVVRLKGGDPFVFGRGGEEGLALAAAGISFEVVPGVSSAIAAARPRRHTGDPSRRRVRLRRRLRSCRGRLSSDSREPGAAQRDRRRDDGLGRGSSTSPRLLVDRGWNAMTPAAVIFGASTSSSSVWTTSRSRALPRARGVAERDPGRRSAARRRDYRGRSSAEVPALGFAQVEADEAAAGGQ